jgi:hypothetical protein
MTITSLAGLETLEPAGKAGCFPGSNSSVARYLRSHVAASALRGSRPGLRQWSRYLGTCSEVYLTCGDTRQTSRTCMRYGESAFTCCRKIPPNCHWQFGAPPRPRAKLPPICAQTHTAWPLRLSSSNRESAHDKQNTPSPQIQHNLAEPLSTRSGSGHYCRHKDTDSVSASLLV